MTSKIVELPKKLSDELRIFARRKPTPLTVKQLYDVGGTESLSSAQRRMIAGQFLYTELPIRLARMWMDLENLPHGLTEMPSVQRVNKWYVDSFAEMLNLDH